MLQDIKPFNPYLLVFLTLFLSMSTYAAAKDPIRRAAAKEKAIVTLFSGECPCAVNERPE